MTPKPQNLFFIDSLGAALSATLYILVLARFENIFGMPQNTLYFLSLLATIYAAYSCLCYLINLENWKSYLKIIALANLVHCCLIIGLLFYFYQQLTFLGLLYFIGEIIIVSSLAIIELKTATTLPN
jgi:hypothetical protein